jgi:hypothetical protein
MRNSKKIEGDSEWEMQGDLEKIWRDPGEIGDRISRRDTRRSGRRNLMGMGDTRRSGGDMGGFKEDRRKSRMGYPGEIRDDQK